jgi:tetratricopeptide (TPR) repeat protein
MRSDHRHELKTNELADWLMHFPEWAEKNRNTLLIAGAAVVVILAIYVARLYRGESAATQNQARLTRLVGDLATEKDIAARAPDKFLGFGITANALGDFANSVGDKQMAAFALIKRGEALRAELHYATDQNAVNDAAKQIDQAKQCYTEALQKASSSSGLAATAQFGLALCEEESGNLDKAKELYHEIAKNTAYEGTAARAAAASRVKTVDDHKSAVVFPPAPPKPVAASGPRVEARLGDANAPVAIPTPNTVTIKPVAPKAPEGNNVSQPGAVAPAVKPTQPAEANRPAATGGQGKTDANQSAGSPRIAP